MRNSDFCYRELLKINIACVDVVTVKLCILGVTRPRSRSPSSVPVILFWISGCYLFPYIWENLSYILGKYSPKYTKLGKKDHFWNGNDALIRR